MQWLLFYYWFPSGSLVTEELTKIIYQRNCMVMDIDRINDELHVPKLKQKYAQVRVVDPIYWHKT